MARRPVFIKSIKTARNYDGFKYIQTFNCSIYIQANKILLYKIKDSIGSFVLQNVYESPKETAVDRFHSIRNT